MREELVGTTVGDRFELLAFAGAGGMGHIYRARDVTNGAEVAIKLLSPQTGDVARFAREANVLARIDHPGVVRYVDHGTAADGAQYLAMEWLEGQDLAQHLGGDATLGIDQTLAVAEKSAEALAAAHRAGVVHRDLKPANIFLVGGSFETIKLLDFGIARVAASSELTITGVIIGTPSYMAPEQVRGERIGAAADVYGVGAVLFRCLVGRPPFKGTHQLAVLAKVVIEPAPSVRELRAGVPLALEALVARLLAKEPGDRPADGEALLAEIRELAAGAPSERRMRAAVTGREQRIATVVLCAGGSSPRDETMAEDSVSISDAAIRSAVAARGGSLDALARGGLLVTVNDAAASQTPGALSQGGFLVTIPKAASSAEQALRAAQCALAIAALKPDMPIFVATGRVLVTGQGRVGEVLDRAAAALANARAKDARGGVRIDAATADLVAGRFELGESDEQSDEWCTLVREEEGALPVRMLLGKPAPLVGRDAQLAMLNAAVLACADESHAGAALIVAPPALGKTHLVHELLRTTGSRCDVLVANGDPIRAASAFGIASQIITRSAGIRDTDTPAARAERLSALVNRDFAAEDAPTMRELLGELCDVATPVATASAALRGARADASVMADALRDAWTRWLASRAANATVLVVLEDAHWADAASVRLLEAALASLGDRPLFVLATSRPEGAALFAERFRPHGLVELTLGPLSPSSAERLVRGALGPSVDPELARALVRRSGGHPFHLEELVRAVADGRGPDALPDSILGMVQARLDDLGAEARRALRAASIFGQTFRASGVAALMGDDLGESDVKRILVELVDKEIVTQERGAYHFRHMLFRDAAYATLADADRIEGHRGAAAWLADAGEPDDAVLGEHYDRGGVPALAAGHFQRAAAQALRRSDFDRARAHAERALTLGPDEATEAALRAIEAELLYWRGEIVTAAERAPSAIDRLPRATPEWFEAVSVAVGALGQLGRNDEVATLLRDAARVASPIESRAAHVVALCRGMTQLFWAHAGAGLGDVRSRLDALVRDGGPPSESLDAYTSGWVHRVRGESAWLHERDIGRCLAELDASCEAFASARALRPLCLSRLNTASLAGWSGDTARGLELVASARADAARLGAGFLLRYGRAVEGLLLAYAGDATAIAVMEEALGELGGSPRLSFICRVVLGSTAIDRGAIDDADAHARAMTPLAVADDLRCAGLALGSRVALARGDVDAAITLALEGTRIAGGCVDLELTFGMSGLALAEAHAARGDRVAAREALAPVAKAIAAIAATIPEDAQRRRFAERPLANDRIARLARELASS